MNRKEQLTIGFSLLLLFCGCSDTGTNNGMLKVSLTDSPACGFDQVNVTPAKIRIHESGSADDQDAGWHDIDLSATGKINLTSLTNGTLRELG
ncbi:MAG TPA: DUF4382 domain-containing protein, partial [Candidatus Manganitrophaceae bacterium]|nr:DUF4382 domain-containing protein [Candidatus Manganitrophaceae bacterium]